MVRIRIKFPDDWAIQISVPEDLTKDYNKLATFLVSRYGVIAGIELLPEVNE